MFTTCQILMKRFYNVSDFKKKNSEGVRLCNQNFTTRQNLHWFFTTYQNCKKTIPCDRLWQKYLQCKILNWAAYKMKFLQRVGIWMKNSTKCQVFELYFYKFQDFDVISLQNSDSELKDITNCEILEKKFSTCQTLKKITTCNILKRSFYNAAKFE